MVGGGGGGAVAGKCRGRRGGGAVGDRVTVTGVRRRGVMGEYLYTADHD